MANVDQLRKSITPGSIPQGDRQTLEAGLGDLPLSQRQGQGGEGGSVARPGSIPPSPSDPLGALLGGQMPVDDDEPTAGMSVGAGPGAPQEEQPFQDSTSQRLRLIASQAKNPMLRAQARAALRYRVRQGSIS